ncbi:MAG: hypothetical protein AVO34_10325 [Firmicutes bacterium ML8_F2]|nr:MAG: hypothetical protein AVO34_10325 [Firmicutes bacterium ML8_F2]
MKRFFLPLVLILVLLGCTICYGCERESENYFFTVEDAVGEIEIGKGETFTIELEENPSTGFSWHWTVNPEGAVVLDADEFAPAENEELVGAPGSHQFVFRAEEAGEAEVLFQYYRDWEPENITETYTFNVAIE